MTDHTLFLYKIQLARPAMLTEPWSPEEEAVMARHAAYLEKLVADGPGLLVGRTLTTDAATFGLCLFRATSAAAAQAIMEADPGVQAGIWRAELFPFKISFLNPVWEAASST